MPGSPSFTVQLPSGRGVSVTCCHFTFGHSAATSFFAGTVPSSDDPNFHTPRSAAQVGSNKPLVRLAPSRDSATTSQTSAGALGEGGLAHLERHRLGQRERHFGVHQLAGAAVIRPPRVGRRRQGTSGR